MPSRLSLYFYNDSCTWAKGCTVTHSYYYICIFRLLIIMRIYVYVFCCSVYKPPDANCSMGWNSSLLNNSSPCFSDTVAINRMDAYRLCVALFAVCLGPFTFFNVQKTTALQIITSTFRWLGKYRMTYFWFYLTDILYNTS